MSRGFFENDFFNSYYYANIIDNVLSGDLELIGFISNYKEAYGMSLFLPFQKFSAFHCFIAYIVSEFFIDDMNEYDKKEFEAHLHNPPLRKLYAEWPLRNYDLDYSFKEFLGNKTPVTWEDIEDYHDELHITGYLEELFTKIADEVFYLLFNNRELLMRFNYLMSQYTSSITIEGLDEEDKSLFKKDGVLKRSYVPKWVKNAVYFRDRGRCCNCNKDLTSLVNIVNKGHYDHIIPLDLGGLNDVTNFQLLCEQCNQEKGKSEIYTSDIYEKWF